MPTLEQELQAVCQDLKHWLNNNITNRHEVTEWTKRWKVDVKTVHRFADGFPTALTPQIISMIALDTHIPVDYLMHQASVFKSLREQDTLTPIVRHNPEAKVALRILLFRKEAFFSNGKDFRPDKIWVRDTKGHDAKEDIVIPPVYESKAEYWIDTGFRILDIDNYVLQIKSLKPSSYYLSWRQFAAGMMIKILNISNEPVILRGGRIGYFHIAPKQDYATHTYYVGKHMRRKAMRLR